MKMINVNDNDQSLGVQVEKVGQQIWFKSQNQTWCYDLIDLSQDGEKRRKILTASPNVINAPMPGKITKVFVKVGDQVSVGQPLLVMEAMKMEYTLKSDLETTVELVNIQVNDQVAVGSTLVKLTKV